MPGTMSYFETPHYGDRAVSSAQEIAASVTPWSTLGRRDRQDILSDETWQAKVRLYDRSGPGIVGASLDMPAATSMLLDLCVRKRTVRGWEVVKDDPVLTAVLQMWRGDTLDQKHLFSRLLRTLDGPAECYMILHNADRPGRLYWQLAQTTNVTDNRDGSVTVRRRRGARRGDKWHQIISDRWVYHAMTSDLEWDGEAWSPLRRALPHIEQYKAAMRAISRNLDSQLAMNGILWAKAVGAATEWPDAVKAWAERAITSDDGPESVMPFPMVTEEAPQWLDVGRGDHEDQIKVADQFLKAFAQSVDLPTQMLLEGPGQGNHWSAYLEGDFYAMYVMQPRWARVCNVITETHLRPLLRGLPATAGYLNPDDYEVWADDTAIRTRVDNTDRIVAGFQEGIVDRRSVLEAIGGNPEQLLELPEGVTEYEHWLASRSPGLAVRGGDSPGVQGLVDDPATAVGPVEVLEPDRAALEDRQQAALEAGAPDVAPAPVAAAVDVDAAITEITGELTARRPVYWNELVPHR